MFFKKELVYELFTLLLSESQPQIHLITHNVIHTHTSTHTLVCALVATLLAYMLLIEPKRHLWSFPSEGPVILCFGGGV